KYYYNKIFAEDREVCERVQRGVSSPHFKGGRLVELERAVVDFHHYLGKFLFDVDHSSRFLTEHASMFGGKETLVSDCGPRPMRAYNMNETLRADQVTK
ncbi:MAG: SRPBCC family protein, partial [Pseudomonadota bacterium]